MVDGGPCDRQLPQRKNRVTGESRLVNQYLLYIAIAGRARAPRLGYPRTSVLPPLTKSQLRQFIAKQIAIYIPADFEEPNGNRYVANVEHLEVVARSDIATPWPARRDDRWCSITYRKFAN